MDALTTCPPGEVDVHALAPVKSHHDDFGSEASTFDVKLDAITLRIAHGSTAGAAAAFNPAPMT